MSIYLTNALYIEHGIPNNYLLKLKPFTILNLFFILEDTYSFILFIVILYVYIVVFLKIITYICNLVYNMYQGW